MSWPKSTPEYAHLKTWSHSMGSIYGPAESRRFGITLGINPLGSTDKICSFDCPYCELGPTVMRLHEIKKTVSFMNHQEIITAVRASLNKFAMKNTPIDTLCISGNGEPTLYPELPELIELMLIAREELSPQSRLVILTNGFHLESRKLLASIKKMDLTMVKVDAGNDNLLKLINRPITRASLKKLLDNSRQLANLGTQTLFVQGAVDNTQAGDIEDWIEIMGMLKPQKVHLTTLDRVPAVPGLKKVDEDTLYTIATKLKRRTSLDAEVFP